MTEHEKNMSPERIRELFSYNPETGLLYWKVAKSNNVKIGAEAGWLQSFGYRRIEIKGFRSLSHRVAWAHHHGEWPSDEIDHINGIRDDNRIGNLRVTSHRENNLNRPIHRNGRLPGCSLHTNKSRRSPWISRIWIAGKRHFLGSYKTEQEAHEAYMEAVDRLEAVV